MTKEKAIEILIKHNKWRRDKDTPPKTEMVNPKELGKAIDFAIDFMKKNVYNGGINNLKTDKNGKY